MNIDTLLRQHAEVAQETIGKAQPPPVARITRSTRRVWATAAGVVAVAAATGFVILALTAPVADPGSFLSGESPSTTVSVDATDEVVTTTMPVPSELEPAGVALQDEIVADGVVSREERERAVAAMAECMTSHGVTGVTWSVTWSDEGDWFQEMGWDSPTADAHLLTEALCYYSYLDRVDSALSASDR